MSGMRLLRVSNAERIFEIVLRSRADVSGARLHYRRVNQAENYVTAEMKRKW